MKNLVNFSHPLSEAALLRLEDMIGESVQEIIIPCQLDLEAPMGPQLDALLQQSEAATMKSGREGRGYGMDLYIPPALSYAAGYLTAKLSYAQSDAMLPVPPAMVVLRREGTPPQFMPVEILRG